MQEDFYRSNPLIEHGIQLLKECSRTWLRALEDQVSTDARVHFEDAKAAIPTEFVASKPRAAAAVAM